MKAAKEFGKMPHEWDKSPAHSRAEAIAFIETQSLVEAYQMERSRESSN